jgi:hypothetical protein
MKNGQGVAKVEKRREARAHSQTIAKGEEPFLNFGRKRFRSAMRPRIAFGRLEIIVFLSGSLCLTNSVWLVNVQCLK